MAQAEVIMLGEATAPKAPSDKIDIYYTKSPENKYDEIAKISVGDTEDDWMIKQIKIKFESINLIIF